MHDPSAFLQARPAPVRVLDGGPWRGPSLEAWLRRMSPWPIPWVDAPTTPHPCDDCHRVDGTHNMEIEH